MKSPEIPILYEDNHLLVVEKPVNIPSQADQTGDPDLLTLLKADLKERYQKPGNVYLGLVHRLDRPVGGVMILARTSKAAGRLSDQIRQRQFDKVYQAVVHGTVEPAEGTLHHYLIKDESTNMVRAVRPDCPRAKEALLDYQVLGMAKGFSWVQIHLHTGRSHQIRVQFATTGHPLYGDQRYGQGLTKPGEQIALWAVSVTCIHPTQNTPMTFTSKPPGVIPWTYF